MALVKDLFIKRMIVCVLKFTENLDMLETEEIESLFFDIAPMLGEIWLHVSRSSVEFELRLFARWCGFALS